MPDHLLDELLPWLMQHRVLSDDEVRRDLRRWVPEYQPAVGPTLQSVPTGNGLVAGIGREAGR
ncbi:capsular polysaccharide biosynthesis [Burkholderia pseudomallei]|nr:capsular polysaccharide biosynthesis [Burkholderia pseudomallei]